MNHLRLAIIHCVVPLSITGCSLLDDDSDNGNVNDYAISGGTDDPNLAKLNAVSLNSECAGTALDNEWVLTTARCASLLLKHVDQGTLSSTGELRPIRHVDTYERLGIIQMHPFSSVPGGRMNIWTGPLASKELKCVGRLDSCLREWRTGQFTAAEDTLGLFVGKSLEGHELDQRDNGAACFYSEANVIYFAGLQEMTQRDPALNQMISRQLPIGPRATAIDSITNRSWMIAYRPSVPYVTTAYWSGAPVTVTPSQPHPSNINAWDKVVVLRNHTVLFYDKESGMAETGFLVRTPTSSALEWHEQYNPVSMRNIGPGLTHITNVGLDKLILYNANTNRSQVADLLSISGTLRINGSYQSFIAPVAHLAGLRNGMFVANYSGAPSLISGRVNDNLTWSQISSGTNLRSWTDVQAFGDDKVFWYDRNYGLGLVGRVPRNSGYVNMGNPRTLPGGFEVLGLQTGQVILWGKNSNETRIVNFDASFNMTVSPVANAPIGNWPISPSPWSTNIIIAAE